DRPVIVGVPRSAVHLAELAAEFHALSVILSTTPALQRDRVALKEITGRMDAIRDLLEREVQSTFAPDACDWYARGGAQLHAPSDREYMVWLSERCDEAYDHSPIIRNELLNRDELSSAAAKARRNLLELMVLG